MTRHVKGRGVATVLDGSNTNPLCPNCERRTFAIDETRTACRTCGEVFVVEARAVRLVAAAFGGVVIVEVD